jgi:hypothetical protein
MATTFKEGDRVQIVNREATAEDAKTGLFYNHFRGLRGTIQKLYATQEAAVEIEIESLPEPIAHRHTDVQEQMKSRWLDGLSERERDNLTDNERDFRLRYTILVHQNDLTTPDRKTDGKAPTPSSGNVAPRPSQEPSQHPEAPRRATSADLEAAEQAYLQSRQRDGRG